MKPGEPGSGYFLESGLVGFMPDASDVQGYPVVYICHPTDLQQIKF